MVILPTEKRFDWKHAPVVLFFLVLLNMLIFFFFQSSDEDKIGEALNSYMELGYLESEWPIFENFLISNDQSELLAEYRKTYKQTAYQNRDYLRSYHLLTQPDFSEYLDRHKQSMRGINDLEEWAYQRNKIVEKISSSSSLSFGLVPANPSVKGFLTHQFMHGDVMHLFGNLFFLIVCGFAVEAAIGHMRFLAFYLVSGVAGGLLHMYFNSDSSSPLIGASGAISGVMAMYLGIFRFKKIEFFYWFFIFVGYFRAPALLILPFYVGKELYSFYSDTSAHVAFMAHAGGFIAGFFLMLVALLISPKMLNEEYIEEEQDVDHRQEKLAKVYGYIERFQFQSARNSLEAVIKEFGLTFELAVLNYNLLKPEKNKKFLHSILVLLKMEKLTPQQLATVEVVWLENPKIQVLLKNEDVLKLGWRFSVLPDVSTAENIFHKLLEKQPNLSGMSAFAMKLSVAFENKSDATKKQQFVELAESLS